jgi:protein-tyrosine kinase
VGKIFDALEKFSKERGGPVVDRFKNSDYEALMKFDEATGRIDVADPKIAKDPRILKRLKTFRLINDNGTLTPAGRAKYEEMLRKSKQKAAAAGSATVEKPIFDQKETIPSGFERARQSDWALLMNYDRQTGNLLKYDPQTGQLDENSRSILQDSATVQRLIDNQLILPGGWLTPEARRECSRLEQELKNGKIEAAAEPVGAAPVQKPSPAPEPVDSVSQADMEVLQDYDPETLKLNAKNPLIVKNPEILKRFLESGLIDAEGRLSARALVRCQALTLWKKEFEGKKSTPRKPAPSIGEKLQAIAEKNKPQSTAAEAGEKKLKIISLKKDETEAKTEDRAEDKTKAGLETQIETKKAAEKAPGKLDHFVTALEARADALKPSEVPSEKRFTLGEAAAPSARGEIDKNLITLNSPQSFEAEQFKILRTNLLFPESGKTPRSVMVTSAMSGEGKSFVAANLAVSVARHVNWNVLLIDCDLRRPSIHSRFGFQNVPGLSDYLTNGTALSRLMLKTGIKNLTILPAGKPPENPSELLSSERMAALIKEVAARYDDRLIIIDSPPPKLTAESGALARYVDGILLVVKYGRTPKNSATELIAKLGKNKIIGAVVNNFDAGTSRYHKKYYGGTYYTNSKS